MLLIIDVNYKMLKAVLHELYKLELDEAYVAEKEHNAEHMYNDLEQLICQVQDRIHLLLQDQRSKLNNR